MVDHEINPLHQRSYSQALNILSKTNKIIQNSEKYIDYVSKQHLKENDQDIEILKDKPMNTFRERNTFYLKSTESQFQSSRKKIIKPQNSFFIKIPVESKDNEKLFKEAIILQKKQINEQKVELNLPKLSLNEVIKEKKSRNKNAEDLYKTGLKTPSFQLKSTIKTISQNPKSDFYWNFTYESIFSDQKFEKKINNIEYLKEIFSEFDLENYNQSTILTKEHNQESIYSGIYTLKSASVSFKNSQSENKFIQKHFEIYIPFAIVPFFYMLDKNELIQLLVFGLNLSKNFNEISLDSSQFIKVISTILNDKKNNLISPKKHFHNIYFEWVTPQYIYEVVLKFPVFEILFEARNIRIDKIVDYSTIIKLNEDNYQDWDKVIMKKMNQQLKFRKLINKLFSKYNENENQDDGISGIGNRIKVHQFDVQEFQEKNKEDTKSYIIGFTNISNENNCYYVQPEKIECEFGEEEKVSIDLNFFQTKIMRKLSSYCDVDTFIRRMVTFEGDLEKKLKLDLSVLNNVDNNFLNSLKKSKRKIDSKLRIRSTKPVLNIQTISHGKIRLKTFTFHEDFLRKLVNTEISKWKNVFFEFQTKIFVDNFSSPKLFIQRSPVKTMTRIGKNSTTQLGFKLRSNHHVTSSFLASK